MGSCCTTSFHWFHKFLRKSTKIDTSGLFKQELLQNKFHKTLRKSTKIDAMQETAL